jgi:hypothetical protein
MLLVLTIGSQNPQSSPTLWKPAHRRPANEHQNTGISNQPLLSYNTLPETVFTTLY